MKNVRAEEILSLLQGVRQQGGRSDSWMALCPCPGHNGGKPDTSPSFSIRAVRDDETLVKCFTGCTWDEISAALGPLGKKTKTLADYNDYGVSVAMVCADRYLDEEFLKKTCYWENKKDDFNKPYISIPYLDEDGKNIETIHRRRVTLYGKRHTMSGTGDVLRPYGLWRLKDADKKRIVIVEGETDCVTLWQNGYNAIGIPGASNLKCLDPKCLADFEEVYVWQETDVAGEKFAASMSRHLKASGITAKVISHPDHKDPCVMHRILREGFREKFDAIFAEAKEADESKAGEYAKGEDKGDKKRTRREKLEEKIQTVTASVKEGDPKWYELNEDGIVDRFYDMYGNVIKTVEIAGKIEFAVYREGVWKIDDYSFVISAVRNAINQIKKDSRNPLFKEVREEMEQYAEKMGTFTARKIIVESARNDERCRIESSVFDRHDMLLNASNGIIDLRTGELHPHDPAKFLTKKMPTAYRPDAKCPTWDNSLGIIFADDPNRTDYFPDTNLIEFIQRFFGYAMTGMMTESIMPIFWGDGSNGKSTVINTIVKTVGREYFLEAPASLLVRNLMKTDKDREIAMLKGKRIVVCNESDERDKIDETLIKKLTSTEWLTGKKIYRDYESFRPTQKIIMCTNNQPKIHGSDNGIWRRLALVPFNARFWNSSSETGMAHLRGDKDLDTKLESEREGILRWIVDGAVAWAKDGLKTPESVLKETMKYRAENDSVGKFIDERIHVSDQNHIGVPFSHLYSEYVKWCEQSREHPTSKIMLGKLMRRKGFVINAEGTGKSCSVYCKSISLKTQDVMTDADRNRQNSRTTHYSGVPSQGALSALDW